MFHLVILGVNILIVFVTLDYLFSDSCQGTSNPLLLFSPAVIPVLPFPCLLQWLFMKNFPSSYQRITSPGSFLTMTWPPIWPTWREIAPGEANLNSSHWPVRLAGLSGLWAARALLTILKRRQKILTVHQYY